MGLAASHAISTAPRDIHGATAQRDIHVNPRALLDEECEHQHRTRDSSVFAIVQSVSPTRKDDEIKAPGFADPSAQI